MSSLVATSTGVRELFPTMLVMLVLLMLVGLKLKQVAMMFSVFNMKVSVSLATLMHSSTSMAVVLRLNATIFLVAYGLIWYTKENTSTNQHGSTRVASRMTVQGQCQINLLMSILR